MYSTNELSIYYLFFCGKSMESIHWSKKKKKYFPQLRNCMVIYLDDFLLHRPFFFFCFVTFVIDCTYIFGNIMQSL